jgi:hypothetical protein
MGVSVQHRFPRSRRGLAAGLLALLLVPAGCVRAAVPEPAQSRTTPPPWDAPRDAISYIEAAGLEPLPLDLTENQSVLTLHLRVDGTAVQIPAFVGVDRVRAVQAAVHTHDSSGQVWLEGKGTKSVTLGHFFTLWGVRLDDRCVGNTCGAVRVLVDGAPVRNDPRAVTLRGRKVIEVSAES